MRKPIEKQTQPMNDLLAILVMLVLVIVYVTVECFLWVLVICYIGMWMLVDATIEGILILSSALIDQLAKLKEKL